MRFSLSTNWNVRRHETGEALTDEILSLGFDALELGYHTTDELAAGIRRRNGWSVRWPIWSACSRLMLLIPDPGWIMAAGRCAIRWVRRPNEPHPPTPSP